MKARLWLVASVLFLTACASTQNSSSENDVSPVPPTEVATFRASDPEPVEPAVDEFDNIPDEIMPHVQKWLNYFQGRGREHMERYLSRSSRYERLMRKILRENQMPSDLIYVALIESGFSPKAISRAAAVGYWQFIRGTGRKFGLEINAFVDERRDPVLATQAAADYFKGLYGEFNSWYLAMASYNVGEGRVRREVRKNKTKEFWVLIKKRRLPKETLNYVPKFLAARMIAKSPEKYGFVDIPFEPPIEFETIPLDSAVNLRQMAEKMGIDYAELKRLNPRYRGEVAPVSRGVLELRVPLGTVEQAKVAARDSVVTQLVFIADKGETDVYKVRRGDTLSTIARRFRTSVAKLKDINNLGRGTRIRAGRTIFVPLIDDRSNLSLTVAKKMKASPDEAFHVVQKGETLIEIAARNQMTVDDIRELNAINEGEILKVGVKLRVKKVTGEIVAAGGGAEDRNVAKVEAAASENVATEPAAEVTKAQASGKVVNEDSDSRIHRVKRGENLSVIARKYGTTVQAIKKANNLGRRSILKIGITLVIPSKDQMDQKGNPQIRKQTKASRPVVHFVKKGESLSLIALKYRVSLSDLLKRNKATRSEKLLAGDKLFIPRN